LPFKPLLLWLLMRLFLVLLMLRLLWLLLWLSRLVVPDVVSSSTVARSLSHLEQRTPPRPPRHLS
jgi:hypothetical protein